MPDFSTLKPVSTNQPDFSTLKPYSEPKIDTSEMPRSRVAAPQPGDYLPRREYLDTKTGKYVPDTQSTFGQRLSGATEQLLDPAFKTIASAVRSPIDMVRVEDLGMDPLPNKDKLPSGKMGESWQSEFATKTKPAVEAGRITPLEATANVVGGVVGGASDILGAEGIADSALSKVEGLSHYVKGRIEGGDKIFESALKDVTPNFKAATPSEKASLITQPSVNGVPRVQEGGFFSGRPVTSTPVEAEIANKLSTVQGYKPNMTALEKSNLIQDRIAVEASQMRSSLQNEPFIAPPKEIASVVKKAISSASQDSLLLSNSDPILKNYIKLVNNASQKVSGDLEGVLDLKQTLDAAYKNAKGKMAFGDGRLTTLDEVHTAARDSLTKYMIENAQNTDVKSALRSQWLLYKADDVLSKTASKEATTAIGRFGQKHPILKNIGKMAAKGAGLGAGIHLVP